MSRLKAQYDVGKAVGKGGYAIVYKVGLAQGPGSRGGVKCKPVHPQLERHLVSTHEVKTRF
jgi:hypothetical protein